MLVREMGKKLRVCLVVIQILVETFRIQILSRDVSDDESELFHETVWLVSWILIQKNSEPFVGKE